MVFTRAINWDEFYYYSQVGAFLRGDLTTALQTIHVRLFAWLPGASKNGVDAIVMARWPMFAYEVGTLISIYAISRRFSAPSDALLCVLAYVSSGFVLQHGFSFRVDPAATCALMMAVAILVRTTLSWVTIVLFALLAAFGGMTTIKAIFYLPIFAAAAALRWRDSGYNRVMAVRIVAAGLFALTAFCAAYAVHAGDLGESASGSSHAAHETSSHLLATSATSLFFIGVPPYLDVLIKGISLSLPMVALIAITPYAVHRYDRPAFEKVVLLAFLFPLTTILFYRNTAPYFHTFMLAPVAVSLVPAVRLVLNKFPAAIVAACMALVTIPVFLNEDRETIERQREVIGVAEHLFRGPVYYFDHNGMIATYRKANGFMTPWGLENYHRQGVASYAAAMTSKTIPLLLENDELLTRILRQGDPDRILLPQDREALISNYLPYWGPIWLAGKAVDSGGPRTLFFPTPGLYRAEHTDVIVDGKPIKAGRTITLTRGNHEVSADGHGRLIWADLVNEPRSTPPRGRIWIGF